MRTKFFILFALGIFALMVLISGVSAVTLADWPLTADGVATNVDDDVTAESLTSGAGISALSFGANGAFADSWTIGTSPVSDEYFEVILSPKTGFDLVLSNMTFTYSGSSTGPDNVIVQYSKNSGFSSPTNITPTPLTSFTDILNPGDNEKTSSPSLSSVRINSGETIYIRWFAYGAIGPTGTFRLKALSFDGSTKKLSVSSPPLLKSANSTTITVTNDGNTPLTGITLTQTGNFNVTLSPSSISSLNAGANSTITATRTTSLSSLNMGTNTVTIMAKASDGTNSTGTITLENSFCDLGAVNYTGLDLNVDIKNKGQGNDNEWLALDTIEVEVKMDNDITNVDLRDVVFEIALFEEDSTKNIIDDMIWISDDEDEFEFGDIDENKDGKHVFEFRIDPEIDKGDYILMVKAYPSGDEDKYCIDYSSDLSSSDFGSSTYYADISIEKETNRNKMVVIDEQQFTLIEAGCGQQVTFTADVYNIGDIDFEDQFMVTLINTELGIDLRQVVLEDLDAGEKAEVSFTFTIPSTAKEKQYTLSMRTYYDYDEGDGTYETDYDKRSEDSFNAYLKVKGNCIINKTVSVSATLESGGKAGKELIVKATITNSENESVAYNINIADYAEWASSASVDSSTFTLNAGASKEIKIALDVKKGVSGSKLFYIEVLSDNQLIKRQPVSVSIEKAGFSLPGITGSVISEENWYIWTIAGVFVVLVFGLSIALARRARRGRAP